MKPYYLNTTFNYEKDLLPAMKYSDLYYRRPGEICRDALAAFGLKRALDIAIYNGEVEKVHKLLDEGHVPDSVSLIFMNKNFTTIFSELMERCPNVFDIDSLIALTVQQPNMMSHDTLFDRYGILYPTDVDYYYVNMD
jgi:hypothetical protein